jgi:hypothetical protein
VIHKEAIDLLDISQFAEQLFLQRDANEVLPESVFKQAVKDYFSKRKSQCAAFSVTHMIQVRGLACSRATWKAV